MQCKMTNTKYNGWSLGIYNINYKKGNGIQKLVVWSGKHEL